MALNQLKDILGHILADHHDLNLSDKQADFGLNEKQNQLVRRSKSLSSKITELRKLVTSELNKQLISSKTKKSFPFFKTFLLSVNTYFDAYEAIAKDADYQNIDNDLELLKTIDDSKTELPRKISLPSYILVSNVYKKTMAVLKDIHSDVEKYVIYKDSNKPSRISLLNPLNSLKLIKHGWQNLKGNKFKIGAGIFGVAAGLFAKSSGISALGAASLYKTSSDIKKQRDIKIKLKQQVEKLNSDITINDELRKLKKRFDSNKSSFAGGGTVTAKRNNVSALIGDNIGNRELFTVSNKNKTFKGITKSPSLLKLKLGSTLSVSPLSSKPNPSISKINPDDFKFTSNEVPTPVSKFAGGTDYDIENKQIKTDVSDTNKIVIAINKNTDILKQMKNDANLYYKNEQSRADDLANSSKGIGKSSFKDMSMGEKIGGFVDSKDKGSYLGDVTKEIIGTYIGAKVFSKLGPVASKIPGVGKLLGKTKITDAVLDMENFSAIPKKTSLLNKIPGISQVGNFISKIPGVGVLGKMSTKIPILGGLLAGGLNYASGAGKGASIGSGLGTIVGGGLGSLLTPFIGPLGTIGGGIIGEIVGKKIGEVFDNWKSYWEKIKEWFKPFVDFFSNTGKSTKDAISKGYDATKTAVTKTWNAGKEVLGFKTADQKQRENILENAITAAGITDPKEKATFMGRAAQETDNFKAMKEYSSGKQYEGRKDLGNTEIGDGEKYKGRGYIQLTGRSNYKTYGDKVGVDLLNFPDLAADPEIAAKIAIEWWKDHNLGAKAKIGDVTGVVQGINGGTNGLNDTINNTNQYYNKYTSNPQNTKVVSPLKNVPIPTPTTPSSVTQSQLELNTIKQYDNMRTKEKEMLQEKFQQAIINGATNTASNTIINNINNETPSSGMINVSSGDNSLLSYYNITLGKI